VNEQIEPKGLGVVRGGSRRRKKATEEDNQNTFGFVDGGWEYRHAGQLIPIADLSLDMMAIGIKSHRESAERCFSHGVEHAIGAGELLIAAKKKIKHGEWLSWLDTHCELALRTAQAYMQLARLPVEKRKAIAHLPVEKALIAIRDKERLVADQRAAEEHIAKLEPVWEARRQARAAEASTPAVQKERPQPTAKDHAIRLFDHIAIWLSGNNVEPAPVLRVLIELLTEELEDSTVLSSPPRGRS
jgi:Protein of unknown function (DUF3102)